MSSEAYVNTYQVYAQTNPNIIATENVNIKSKRIMLMQCRGNEGARPHQPRAARQGGFRHRFRQPEPQCWREDINARHRLGVEMVDRIAARISCEDDNPVLAAIVRDQGPGSGNRTWMRSRIS